MSQRVIDAFIGGFIMMLVFAVYKYIFVKRVRVPFISDIVEQA